MKFSFLFLFLTSCVSLGYHQKEMQRQKTADLKQMREWVKSVKAKEITIFDLDDRVKMELYQ